MSGPEFTLPPARVCFGVKGPRAADRLASRGIALPAMANSWCADDELLVARLGASEFFLEEGAARGRLRELELDLEEKTAGAGAGGSSGVYPVLRQDVGFLLSGERALDVLAEVCNVNFGDLDLASRPVVMTLMIGVAVLVVPQIVRAGTPCRYGIWCDPSFGAYLGESVGRVVIDCGGNYRGVST